MSAAAVQGQEFDAAVIAKVMDMDVTDAEDRLETLDRTHGFVRLIGERVFPDTTLTLRYSFVHVLYQNALYASLRSTRKMSLSAAVAETLLAYCGAQRTAIASELAILFDAARDFDRAAEYFTIAAEQAARVSANTEAIVLARRGLDALMLLPETPDRARRELQLQTILGPALMSTVGYGTPEVEAVYTRARELCRQFGETPQLFPVIWGLYQYWLARAVYGTAWELAEQLLAWAQRTNDPALLLPAHSALANILCFSGDLDRARSHAEQAIAIYVPEEHHRLAALYSGFDFGAADRGGLAANLWLLGYPDRAVQSARDGLTLARQLAHSSTIVLALNWEAMVHAHRRDAQRTRQQAEAAIAIAEQELTPWLAWAMVLQGWAMAEQGEDEEGIARVRQGIAVWRAAGLACLLPHFLGLLAAAYARTGHTDEAFATVAEALAITEQTREEYAEAELHRIKGELLRDPEEAEASFRRAIEIARRKKAKSSELRAVISSSRLHDKHGERGEARQMLAGIYGWFTEGFDTADLKDAASLLQLFGPESCR
jgi:predicted ATPase